MNKIAPCLWFDNEAEEAVRFYTSIFKNSSIGTITRYGEAGPRPAGSVMSITFQLDGQDFIALNGGPQFKFNEAISFSVDCKDQAEVDYYWEKLSGGGEIQMCGWLKDKFGVSWQIVPTELNDLIRDPDPVRAARVTQALFQMQKIDINRLKQVYAAE
ncbi:MAG: VOC family protein [Chloroflexi bacterium]|jgi:predicted 3-demethylubiquinone-9 3-methyltransferase (glyoxalase superfamily)|nr:VOC family protein [Chloroflexota bacterium]